MSDYESRREERRRRREERRQRWRERCDSGEYHGAFHAKGSIWTGVFILLVGVGALLKAAWTDLPDWVFSWPMLLLVLGFFIGLRHNFRGVAWFILMVLGGAFLWDKMNPDFDMRRYVWPMALIVVGLFFILRPRRRNWPSGREKKSPDLQDATTITPDEEWSNEDFVDSTSIFGGAKKNIISKNFKGGDLVNVFGGTDLDLTQADFKGTAVIELTTIFGGTKLIIPSNWSIKSEAVILFGGLEDKRKMPAISDSPDKTLVLKGTVIFGGIEIKSY